MILNQLKAQLHLAEPVTREFVAQMNATFRYYAETRRRFFQQIPAHLHQSELVSLINVEIKNRLFKPEFCDGLQDALKALRRALIRLEDTRATAPQDGAVSADLARLAGIGERVEALCQRHWEFYRYQTHLNEEEIVRLLLEVDEIAGEWERTLAQMSALSQVARDLSGRPLPEGQSVLTITYSQQGPQHFSVGSLKSLMDFLEAGYRFIAALFAVDAEAQPLTVLQVDVADPVELRVALPQPVEEPYRKLLQYLFLKDMLKRDALLKFVFDAVEKAFPGTKALTSAELSAFQKDLAAKLKPLPASASFTFADRAFPGDEIQVLNDLTALLERAEVDVEPLLGTGEKTKRAAKEKLDHAAQRAIEKVQEARGAGERPAERSPERPAADPAAKRNPASVRIEQSDLMGPLPAREHLNVLTEKIER